MENHFGLHGHLCDEDYKKSLFDIFKFHIQDKAVIFTTDYWNGGSPACGKIQGAYCTVYFGHGTLYKFVILFFLI